MYHAAGLGRGLGFTTTVPHTRIPTRAYDPMTDPLYSGPRTVGQRTAGDEAELLRDTTGLKPFLAAHGNTLLAASAALLAVAVFTARR